MLSCCCNLTTLPLPYPLSLNSLDLAGFEIAESLWLTRYYHNSCRCQWYQCRWCNWAQMGAQRRSWLLLCFVSCWSVVEPSWDDRGSSSWVIFFSFGFVRSRTMCVLWMMYDLFKYLCEVAIVSQLFIPFLFITWDCVKMTLLATKPQCGYASKSCFDTWEI